MSKIFDNIETKFEEGLHAILTNVGVERAAHASNVEALKLYFYVGGYVSKKTRTAKWGSGAIDALSNRLQVELPGLRGFSASGIKRMRLLFEAWKEAFEIRPLPMDGNPRSLAPVIEGVRRELANGLKERTKKKGFI